MRSAILVSILTPTTLILACGTEVPEGGDPEHVAEVRSAVFKGDTPDTEVIARAKYWFDEGQAGHMGKYTNAHCDIDGRNPDNSKDSSCHRDKEGNGVYPNTHFYRRDCSGMASMAVHMGYSTNTAGFRDGAFDFKKLANDENAKPGDLLLSTAASGNACSYGNHTIIFEKWIDANHWRGYSGGKMPPSRNVYTVTRANGVITNMDKYDGCNRVFHAWRSPHVIHDGPSCTAKSCSTLHRACGSVDADDNCGVALHCGGCGAGETCDDGQCVPSWADAYAKPWWSGRLKNAGQCAEIAGSDPLAGGAQVKFGACSSSAADQHWYITSNRYLKNEKSDKCVEPDSVAPGSLTRQRACGNDDQIFRFREMRVVNGQSGGCLDVPAASYYSGQRVIQWMCHGADNQLFTYKPHTGELAINGWCLDAGDASNGAQVKLRPCDDTASQRWNDAHGGFVSAVDTATPRCLALQGGASASWGANAIVKNCEDTPDQMWGVRGQIEHHDDELCLKNGADDQLKLVTCDDSQPEQRFTFWMNR